MERTELEIVDRGEKRDVHGRVIQNAGERQRILEAYDRSGLTQRVFAEREGIRYQTFVWWLKQRRERQRGASGLVKFEEYQVGEVRSNSPLEVVLADGTRMRGDDPGKLAVLVRALRG